MYCCLLIRHITITVKRKRDSKFNYRKSPSPSPIFSGEVNNPYLSIKPPSPPLDYSSIINDRLYLSITTVKLRVD